MYLEIHEDQMEFSLKDSVWIVQHYIRILVFLE